MTSQSRYTADLLASDSVYPPRPCATITEARRWAEAHGGLADKCIITDRQGRTVAVHARSRNGNGREWYRADCGGT